MENKTTKKQIIISILLMLGGVGLTVMSFCVYYLVEPLSNVALALICVVDFIYAFFMVCMFTIYNWNAKWLLKTVLISVGYIAAFIVVALLFLVFCGWSGERINSNIINVVLYAFFTGPSMPIVVTLFLLCLAYGV